MIAGSKAAFTYELAKRFQKMKAVITQITGPVITNGAGNDMPK
mgnify:CR=1 FL=1